MLISREEVTSILTQYNIQINGVFHVGAHDCEELDFYSTLGVSPNNMVWIDAIQSKVEEATSRNIPNVFQAVITDKDNDSVIFNISNNVQSSSVFNFGSHSTHHPNIHFVNSVELKTTTIDTFFKTNNLNATIYDYWNIDIQGAELLALTGGSESLKSAKAVYLEVNTEEVYKGCALMNDIDKYLLDFGFKRVLTKVLEYGWGDALYVKV
jgi:FkbM family methyltransferase